ncbi:MAG: hypothetical protein J6575_06615 [Bifidobacterium sp.]|nr:hypothetical protein [Bifidobacterium sp.]
MAELKGITMRFRSDGGQCANSGGTGPSSSMFLQGSTSASVTLKGGGKTAVALGSIVSTDFGDAPESFGVAGSMFQPTWQGGELGNGDIPSTNYDTQDSHDPDASMVGGKLFNLSAARDGMGGNANLIAQAEAPSPRLGAHEDGEASPHFDEDADWDDLNGDSAFAAAPGNVVNDEDGVNIPTDTHAVDVQPGADGTFSQKVRCYGTGDVRGWIDWNHDGTFEAAQATAAHEREAEASSQVACTADGTSSTGYSATLTWQLPGDAKRQISADGDPSYMRLRITNQTAPGSSNIINMQPTGITSGFGEVEDYKADVHVPTLSVLTNIVGGRKNTGDQFTMTAQAVSPSTQDLSVTTSGENGIQAAQIGPRSTAPNSQYKISEALTSGSPTPPGDYAKADYEQVGDIVYYLNTDTSRAHPLTLAQAQQSLRNGLSVTGVRTVKGHQPKVTVKVDRDYRFGGAAASDGSKVTLVPSPSGTGVDMTADQAKFVASGTYSVRQLLNAGYKQSDLAVT